MGIGIVGGERDSLAVLLPRSKLTLGCCLPVPVPGISYLLGSQVEDLLIVWWLASRLGKVELEPLLKARHDWQNPFALGFTDTGFQEDFLFLDVNVFPFQTRNLSTSAACKKGNCPRREKGQIIGCCLIEHPPDHLIGEGRLDVLLRLMDELDLIGNVGLGPAFKNSEV